MTGSTDGTDRFGNLFASIDAMDTERFLGFLTRDATFRFGSAEPVQGHAAIATAVGGFFASVAALRHDVRRVIGEVVENGGTLQDAYRVDQSAYAHLDTFDELARLNAGRIFRAMEFE